MPLKEESQRSQPRPALLYIRSLESSHDAKFQERLIWLDEACLSSTKKELKWKVHTFHYFLPLRVSLHAIPLKEGSQRSQQRPALLCTGQDRRF